MDTKRIIADIDTEISKLQKARAILTSAGIKNGNGPGRPKSTEPKLSKPKKRKLSAKGERLFPLRRRRVGLRRRRQPEKATKTGQLASRATTLAH